MIVDIGGGTSEIAVISLGGIVSWRSLRVGGDKMDEAILDYIKKKHNLAIGEQTAEDIKIKIGTALPEKEPKVLKVKGRDLYSGLPKYVNISSNDIAQALQDIIEEIVRAIKFVLRETPPELSADVMEKGIVLSGGGALLGNLDKVIAKETGVPTTVAEDALLCVAKGTGIILENLSIYKKSIMARK